MVLGRPARPAHHARSHITPELGTPPHSRPHSAGENLWLVRGRERAVLGQPRPQADFLPLDHRDSRRLSTPWKSNSALSRTEQVRSPQDENLHKTPQMFASVFGVSQTACRIRQRKTRRSRGFLRACAFWAGICGRSTNRQFAVHAVGNRGQCLCTTAAKDQRTRDTRTGYCSLTMLRIVPQGVPERPLCSRDR